MGLRPYGGAGMQWLRSALSAALRLKPLPEAKAGGTAGSGLQKCLRTRDVVGFGLGATVGAGIFVATGKAAKEAGPAVTLSFLLAAFGCSCTGLCYAELASMAPSTGSSYSFVYHAVGELAACLIGLTNILGNILAAAAVARGWEGYTRLLLLELGLQPPWLLGGFPLGPFHASPVASLLILAVVAINLCGTKAISVFNGVVTAASLLMLLGFILGAGAHIDPANWQPIMPEGAHGVMKAAGTVFFAYLGFDVLATLGEEAEDEHVVPRGIVLTLIISTTLYCAVGLVFTGLVSYGEIELTAPLAHASELRGLHVIALMIAAGAVGNTLTTVIGGVIGAPRLCFAMAQDGLLPESLMRVNKFGAPARSLFFFVVPAASFAGLLEFGPLAEIVSAGALCTFALVCASLVLLRCPRSVSTPPAREAAQASPAPDVIGRSENGDPSRTEEVEDATTASIGPVPRLVSMSLTCYGLSCFAVGLLTRLPAESTTGTPAKLALGLFTSCALVSAGAVVWPFCCGARASAAGEHTAGGFRLPLMPLLPLAGILMNVLVLSQLDAGALSNSLLALLAGVAFYFCYAAPRSRLKGLKDGEKVSLVEL